ncbi:MAG: GNAT family N-acetyltransferase [Burkholderiales bacterium]
MNPRDTLTFRPAQSPEARAMARMSRDLIETGLDWRYTPNRIAMLMGDPETVALVACDAWGLHGFAVMQFGDEHAHLALLCVDPKQQRRGIGRCLTEWLIESAQVAGIARIELELRADNEPALAFYRRLGFAQTRVVPGYYRQNLAARCMVRWLRPELGPAP